MFSNDAMPESTGRGAPQFCTTCWNVVLQARSDDTNQANEALEQFCRRYWYPLYSYVRRRGYGPEDAEDLTQSFILHLLQNRALTRADPSRGRFRSFLLSALTNFLSDQHDRASAQKRGGGRAELSLEARSAEERFRLEPVDDRSPDKLFDRQWAMALLDLVLHRLEREFELGGKAELFQAVRVFLVSRRGEESYATAAAALGTTTDSVRKTVHRLRARYQELFREEVGQTVTSSAQIEDEIRFLCSVVAS